MATSFQVEISLRDHELAEILTGAPYAGKIALIKAIREITGKVRGTGFSLPVAKQVAEQMIERNPRSLVARPQDPLEGIDPADMLHPDDIAEIAAAGPHVLLSDLVDLVTRKILLRHGAAPWRPTCVAIARDLVSDGKVALAQPAWVDSQGYILPHLVEKARETGLAFCEAEAAQILQALIGQELGVLNAPAPRQILPYIEKSFPELAA